MTDFHKILQAIRGSEQKCILATILQVEGTSYRKSGNSMVIFEDGSNHGLLSGGCLEEDISYRAADILERQVSQTFVYDLRAEDDLSWGQGAGCNGLVHVLLEPVTSKLRLHLLRVEELLKQGQTVYCVKKLTKDKSVTDYLFFLKKKVVLGGWSDLSKVLEEGTVKFEELTSYENTIVFLPELDSNVFVQKIPPKPHLIIFGAGPDVRPLVSIAVKTGFTVTVTDWRPAFCNTAKIPDADCIVLGFPNQVIEKLCLKSEDFVVIMTHHFQRDREILQLLTGIELRYLGLLGPRQRTERLYDDRQIPTNVHSPVGLSIGAEGPEEIAISILAELVQILRYSSKEKKA